MAWYNNLGDLAGDIGGIAKNPIVDAGLGVLTGGATVPLLAGAAGGLLSGGGIKGALEGGLSGGLAGKIPGVVSLSSLFGGGNSGSAQGPTSAIPDSAMGLPSVASVTGGAQTPDGTTGGQGFLQSLEGLAGKAGDFLTGNGGKNALNIAQGLNEALLERKANTLGNQALSGMQASYNQRAPLRAVGVQNMLNAQQANPFGTGVASPAYPGVF